MDDRSWLYNGVSKSENVDTEHPNWTHNQYGVSTWSDWMDVYNTDPDNPSVIRDSENPIVNADGNSYDRVRFADSDTANAVGQKIIDDHYNNANGDLLRFATTYINGYGSNYEDLNPEFKERTKNYASNLQAWKNYENKKQVIQQVVVKNDNSKEIEYHSETLRKMYADHTQFIDNAIESGQYNLTDITSALDELKATAKQTEIDQTPTYELDKFSLEYASRIGDSFLAGIGDMTHDIGSAIQWTTDNQYGQDLQKFGKDLREKYGRESDPTLFQSGNVLKDLALAGLDPDFWVNDFARILPNMLTLLVPYGAGFKGVGLAGKGLSKVSVLNNYFNSLGRSTQAVAKLVPKATGGAVLGRMVESYQEAGGLYNDLKREGYTTDEASMGAQDVFYNNMNLALTDATQLALAMAPMPSKIVGDMGKWYLRYGKNIAKVSGAGTIEGAEELAQAYFHDLGKSVARDDDKYIEPEIVTYLEMANKDHRKAFTLGFFAGSGFQAGGMLLNRDNLSNDVIKKTVDPIIQQYKDVIEVRENEKVNVQERFTGALSGLESMKAIRDFNLNVAFSPSIMTDTVTEDQINYDIQTLVDQGLAEQVGEVDGKAQYRIKGVMASNEVVGDQVNLEISEQAGISDVMEDIVEIIAQSSEKSDLRTFNEIKDWISENESQSNEVKGVELFSKAFTYGYMGQSASNNPVNQKIKELGLIIPEDLARRVEQLGDMGDSNIFSELESQEDPFAGEFTNPVVEPENPPVEEDEKATIEEVNDEDTGAVITPKKTKVVVEKVKEGKKKVVAKPVPKNIEDAVKKGAEKLKERKKKSGLQSSEAQKLYIDQTNISKADMIKRATKEGIKLPKSATKKRAYDSLIELYESKVSEKPQAKPKAKPKAIKKEVVKQVKKKPVKKKPVKKAPVKKKVGKKPLSFEQQLKIDPSSIDLNKIKETVTATEVNKLIKKYRVETDTYSRPLSIESRIEALRDHFVYEKGGLGLGTDFRGRGNYSIAVLPERPIPNDYASLDDVSKGVISSAIKEVGRGGRVVISLPEGTDSAGRDRMIKIMTEDSGYVDPSSFNEEDSDAENLIFDNVRSQPRSATFTRPEPESDTQNLEDKEYEVGDGYNAYDHFANRGYSVGQRMTMEQENLSDEDYKELRKGKKTKEEKQNIKEYKGKYSTTKFADWYRTFSTQVAKIHPKLPSFFKKFQFASRDYYKNAMSDFEPFIKGLKDLRKQGDKDLNIYKDYVKIDTALKNSEANKVKSLMEKYDLWTPYQQTRKRFDQFAKDYKSVGLNIGYINDYIGRSVSDHVNLIAYIKEKNKEVITEEDEEVIRVTLEELGQEKGKSKGMTPDLAYQVVEEILLRRKAGYQGKSFDSAKARKILKLNESVSQRFYRPTDEALSIYARQVTEALIQKRFLGASKYGVRAQNKYYIITNKITNKRTDAPTFKYRSDALSHIAKLEKQDIEKSGHPGFDPDVIIKPLLFDLIQKYDIDIKYADRLQELMDSYFTSGRGSALNNNIRTFGHITSLMSGFFSTVTQVADIGLSVWRSGTPGLTRVPTGLARTSVALAKALANRTKISKPMNFISKEDYGVDSIAEEFLPDESKMVTWLNRFAKVTLFEFMDGVGKDTTVNATLRKIRSIAQRPNSRAFAELDYKMNLMFTPSEKANVYRDLINNDYSSDFVRQLAYLELSRVQPIDKSEMPVMYLKRPGGRIFWQLKSFMIKRLDTFQDENNYIKQKSQEYWKNGQYAKSTAGYTEWITRMTMMAMFLALSEAGTDVLKDWMAGRKTSSIPDLVWSNMFKIVGLSKYNYYAFQRDGLEIALMKMIAPPQANMVGTMVDDVMRYGSVYNDKGRNGVIRKMRKDGIKSYKFVPIVGKHLYWWNEEKFGKRPEGLGLGAGNIKTKKYEKRKGRESGEGFLRKVQEAFTN